MRLLSRFMVDLGELRPLVSHIEHDAGPVGGSEHDRAIIDRMASALWGVFSHHRAVVSADGTHYNLGSWRYSAELIADFANAHYPGLSPAIRYMDCYMGVLLGEDRRVESRPLHRWIFRHLQDAGCDWLYSYSPEIAPEDRRVRQRELAAVLGRAYEDQSRPFAPLPAVVAAYQDVYGRLPDGWPHA
jgi:hypothetical protein